MDKLKSVMDYVKRYGFWFFTGMIVVVVLGCWWMATASVAKDVHEQIKTLDDTFKGVESIASTSQHPNKKFIEAVGEEHNKVKENVLKAWNSLYDAQTEELIKLIKETNPKWEPLYQDQKIHNPWPPVLGMDFLKSMDDHPNKEIADKYRVIYLNFIQQYIPKMFQVVDLWRPKEDADSSAAPAQRAGVPLGMAAADDPNRQADMIGVVDWDQNDQLRIKKDFIWRTTPTDLRVRMAQEDIWVILSLLRVIKNTNGGITEHSKAPIKHIDSLEIGAFAVQNWRNGDGQVFKAEASSGAAMGGPGGGGYGPGGGAAGRPANAAPDEKEELLSNRYVNDKGEPLSSSDSQPYAEFKMMPVCIKLYIDQRKIAKLLVECANSAMPIEVRRLRIYPGAGEVVDFATMSSDRAGGVGSMGTPAGSPMGMPGGMPPGMGRAGYGPAGAHGPAGYGGMGGLAGRPVTPTATPGLATNWEKSSMDIPIEIQGIIYIYNPADKDKLGTGAASEKPAADTTAAPAAGNLPVAPANQATPNAAPATPATPENPPATTTPKTPETPAENPKTPPATPPTDTPAVPSTTSPAGKSE